MFIKKYCQIYLKSMFKKNYFFLVIFFENQVIIKLEI